MMIILIVFCVIGLTSAASRSGCQITIPTDIPENEPVYLVPSEKGNFSLFIPTGQEISLGLNQKLYLFCPGSKNQLSNGGVGDVKKFNGSTLLCNSNLKFELDGETVEFNRLNCTKETGGDLRTTRQKCANGSGIVHEIGFKLSPSKFVKQFEVCYNNQTASAIYSKHYINGKAIKFHVRESERRSFKSAGIPRTANPSQLYKKNNQMKYFKTIFGQKYFNDSSFLSRGHLTPDADFVFTTSQFSTYFFANVVPQFQTINGANWQRVENFARNLSSAYNTNLLVYTGTYEQLELENTDGVFVPVWMGSSSKIEVPKWIWKVVINEANNSGIAFVTLNNPFVQRSENIEKICQDVCEAAGIRTTGFNQIRNGYTYCCDVNDLKTVVGVLPTNLRVTSLISANIL